MFIIKLLEACGINTNDNLGTTVHSPNLFHSIQTQFVLKILKINCSVRWGPKFREKGFFWYRNSAFWLDEN